MRSFLYLTCLGVFICIGATFGMRSFKAGPIDTIKALLKIKPSVSHIVVDIHNKTSHCYLYEFAMHSQKNRLRLLTHETWEVHFDFQNVRQLTSQVEDVVCRFKKITQGRRDRTSVSVIMAEKLKNEVTSDVACQNFLKAFTSSGFYLKSNACLFLSTHHKALFTWFLINQNKGFLKPGVSLSHPVVHLSLDFGGVTFAVDDRTNLTTVDPRYVFDVNVSGNRYKIYSGAFSTLGVKRARRLILEEQNKGVDPSKYESYCLYQGVNIHYNTTNISVRGSQSDYTMRTVFLGETYGTTHIVDMDKCKGVVSSLIKRYRNPPRIPQHNIFTVSPYILTYSKDSPFAEWNVNLENFWKASEYDCHYKKNDKAPYQCMDMIYAYVLLRDYFKLTSSYEIKNLEKKYYMNVDWTLGLAFLNVYQRYLGKLTELDN